MSQVIHRRYSYSAPDGQTLVGALYVPDDPVPLKGAVLVAPEWWGVNDYVKERAHQMAELGYVALAIDLYGDGRTTKDAKQAYQWMSDVTAEPQDFKGRVQAGYDALLAVPTVDPNRIAAIGYCFGGKVVLEMARNRIPLQAVACFHGPLLTDHPAQRGAIQGEVFVAQGQKDTMCTIDDVPVFEREMDNAGAVYRVHVYEGARHGFTNPAATAYGDANNVDIAYNPAADRESFDTLKALLKRTIGSPERRDLS